MLTRHDTSTSFGIIISTYAETIIKPLVLLFGSAPVFCSIFSSFVWFYSNATFVLTTICTDSFQAASVPIEILAENDGGGHIMIVTYGCKPSKGDMLAPIPV